MDFKINRSNKKGADCSLCGVCVTVGITLRVLQRANKKEARTWGLGV
jgi:hypothetical protein